MSKITYRTRSKCSIVDRTVLELEENLPPELLFDPETPDSRETDEIWLKFLQNIQQESDTFFEDEKDDPDFTFPDQELDLDCDLNEIRIPRKEADALVKDAAEFYGELIYDNDKNNKSNMKKTSNEKYKQKLNKSINENINDNSINEITIINETNEIQNVNLNKNNANQASNVYIPTFVESQIKQLEEQIRNCVQLMTQSCLYYVDKPEYNLFQEETCQLLNSWKDLRKNKQFEILNLDEALKLIDENKTFKNQEKNSNDVKTPDNNMPPKYLDLIVSSPVFYNSELIPTYKYKYYSQFTKSQFSDSELKLLLLGYEKFGHLERSECCECINKYLLPIRKPNEISRKLGDVLKTDERKEKFMKMIREPVVRNGLDFIVERDYKSLLDKVDNLSLPSMYTVSIERLKMSKLVEERKQILEIQRKMNPELANKKFTKRPAKPSEWLKERLIDFTLEEEFMNEKEKTNEPESSSNTISCASTPKNNNQPSSSKKTIKTTANILQTNQTNSNTTIFQSPIMVTNDLNKILNNTTNNLNAGLLPTNLPFTLPANFQGTIMIQPTIHIHASEKYIKNEITKYRQIIPKGDIVIQNKRRKT